MDMGEIAVTSNTIGVSEALFQFLIKIIIGIALLLPLLVMAVVLIIRAVILRLVIAFSPVLVLMFIYGKESESAAIGGGNLSKLSDVLTLIFFPVFVVFAISLSIVFLTLISRLDFIQESTPCDEDPLSLMGCSLSCNDTGVQGADNISTHTTRNYDCFGVQFSLSESESTMGANAVNTMGWLVKNFLGIALMWAVIFFALKSNKMTKGLVDGVQNI
jgi:hypothetical protein